MCSHYWRNETHIICFLMYAGPVASLLPGAGRKVDRVLPSMTDMPTTSKYLETAVAYTYSFLRRCQRKQGSVRKASKTIWWSMSTACILDDMTTWHHMPTYYGKVTRNLRRTMGTMVTDVYVFVCQDEEAEEGKQSDWASPRLLLPEHWLRKSNGLPTIGSSYCYAMTDITRMMQRKRQWPTMKGLR